MVECKECGKTLGIFEGYKHPTMGTKQLLCSPCFDQVNDSVAKWRQFVLTNAMNGYQINAKLNWKQLVPQFNQRRSLIENVCAEQNMIIRK